MEKIIKTASRTVHSKPGSQRSKRQTRRKRFRARAIHGLCAEHGVIHVIDTALTLSTVKSTPS